MILHLIYQDGRLGEAWRKDFGEFAEVKIEQGDITKTECDAVVSPANSFGFMDGGLDDALAIRLGRRLEQVVQNQIRQLPSRELLVGQALVIPTGDQQIQWLIVAPTMRVPMSFNIATSVNAYLAMKSILVAARQEPSIRSIAVPGLCTGVGRMPPEIASKQMVTAYNEVIQNQQPEFHDFGEAQKHQIDLNPNGMIWDY